MLSEGWHRGCMIIGKILLHRGDLTAAVFSRDVPSYSDIDIGNSPVSTRQLKKMQCYWKRKLSVARAEAELVHGI